MYLCPFLLILQCTKDSLESLNYGQWFNVEILLSNSSPLSSQETSPNGAYSKIASIGSTQLSNQMHVKSILFAPSFLVNLQLVIQLTTMMNCSIYFFIMFCILKDLTLKKMIGLGKQLSGLHYLISPVKSTLTSFSITYHVDSTTDFPWHKHLRHFSKAPSQILSPVTLSFVFDSKHSCETCHLAKQTGLPFFSSSF